MKRLLLFCLIPLLVACKPAPSPKNTTLTIKGMTCESCVNGITSELLKTPGVTGCTVTLSESNAVVQFDSTAITAEQIEKRIDGLGFEASLP